MWTETMEGAGARAAARAARHSINHRGAVRGAPRNPRQRPREIQTEIPENPGCNPDFQGRIPGKPRLNSGFPREDLRATPRGRRFRAWKTAPNVRECPHLTLSVPYSLDKATTVSLARRLQRTNLPRGVHPKWAERRPTSRASLSPTPIRNPFLCNDFHS